MLNIPKRTLGRTSLTIDTLGFGCAPIGNLYKQMDDKSATQLLTSALHSGFKYFDTAPHYGQGLSERRVGDVLRLHKNQDYILSTKVGRLLKPSGYAKVRHGFHSPMPFDFYYDYSYDGIMRSFEDSIQRMGIDKIDIVYMHDIGRFTHGAENDQLFPIAMIGGYKALDELRSQGVIKAIGLGVNEYEVCEAAMEYGNWDCFLLAGRYSLLEQQSLSTFFPKCEKHGASVIIGGPYNSGILATGTKTVNKPYYNYEHAPQHIIEKVKRIETICAQYNVELAAAALQFSLGHPAVCSVIPGIGSADRVDQTLSLFRQFIPNGFWTTLKDERLLVAETPTLLMNGDQNAKN